MNQPSLGGVERRRFLQVVPGCLAVCAAGRAALAASPGAQAQAPLPPAAPKHPFDTELPMKFSYRQMMAGIMYNSRLIPLLLYMRRTLGPEKATELLEAFAAEDGAQGGRAAATRAGGSDFARLKAMFSPQAFQGRLVMDVVQSTETVHELKVTECLWAKTCRDAGAGPEGHAMICHADYAFARGFNPRIELVRDKTLMQGDSYCNHRYLLKE